jgi:hypothetical protein
MSTTRYVITEDLFDPRSLGAQSQPSKVYDTDEDAYELLDEAEFTLNTAGYHTSRGIGSVVGLHADGTVKVIRVVEFTTETILRLEA